MSKIWTADNQPMSPELLKSTLAGMRARHGPFGNLGWAPKPTGIHLSSRCADNDHRRCLGVTIDRFDCTCFCHDETPAVHRR